MRSGHLRRRCTRRHRGPLAPLLRIFFDAVLNQNTTRTPHQDPSLKVPVLMLLDGFARLGKMQRVVDSLQYASRPWAFATP